MSTRTPGPELPVRRVDRILAYMALGLTVLSIVCFFAVMLAVPLGVTDYTAGLWPVVRFLPVLALPVAFLLIVALLIMSFVRRSRANKGA